MFNRAIQDVDYRLRERIKCPGPTSQISGNAQLILELLAQLAKSRSRETKWKKRENTEKALSEPRLEVSDYFVSLNSTWAITNYVIRTRTPSESRKNMSRSSSRDSETAIREELNATNIVFVPICREHRSLSPIIQLIPQKLLANFAATGVHSPNSQENPKFAVE